MTASTVHSILLWSDDLPGLIFSPQVYFSPTGQVYVTENLGVVEFRGTKKTIGAQWIPAGDSFMFDDRELTLARNPVLDRSRHFRFSQ